MTNSRFKHNGEQYLDVGEFFEVEENSRVLLPQQAYYATQMAKNEEMNLSLNGINYLTVGAAKKLIEAESEEIEIRDCNKVVEKALENVSSDAIDKGDGE